MSKLFTSSLTCYLRLILLMLFCLLLVQNTLANNPSRARATLAAFSIINGQPLTINVGEDMSFQVFNSNIVGSGQIYPTDCQSTGDMGILVRTGNVLYAPDFNNHPCGTGATPNNLTYTAWTLVSLSAVSGTGAVNDPLIVTVIGKAGADLTLTMQVSYVNGDSCFLKTLIFENSSPLPISFDVFLASEPYLDNASAPFLGIPYHHAPENSIGQRECYNGRYSLFHIPVNTPADAYTAREYFDAWREISAGNLSNTLSPDCGDNVVALEWQNQQLQASSSLTIQVKTCLGGTPFCPPVATLDSVSALTQRWPVSNYPNIQGMTTLKGNTSPKIVYFTEYDAKKIGKMVLPPTVTTCDSATLTECDLLPLDLQPFKITYAEKPYRISDGNKTYSTNIWFTDPTHSKICGIVPDKPAKGVATVFTYDVGVYPPWDIQWYKPSKGTTLLWYSKPMMADRIFALQPVTAQVANIFYFVFPPGTQIDAFDVRYDYVWLAARDNDNDYLYRMPVSGGTAIRWALQKSTNRFTAVRAIYPAKPRSTQLFPYQVWLTREGTGPITILKFTNQLSQTVLDSICYQTNNYYRDANGLLSTFFSNRVIVTEGPGYSDAVSINRAMPDTPIQREVISIMNAGDNAPGRSDRAAMTTIRIAPECNTSKTFLNGECCIPEQWKTFIPSPVFDFRGAMLDIDMVGNFVGKTTDAFTFAFHEPRPSQVGYIGRTMMKLFMSTSSGSLPEIDFGNKAFTIDEPGQFRVADPYPNPFNPTTTIGFELLVQSEVTVKIYNVLGQEVATLFDHQLLDDGLQEVTVDGNNFSSGVYFVRVTAQPLLDEEGSTSQNEILLSTKKILLVR